MQAGQATILARFDCVSLGCSRGGIRLGRWRVVPVVLCGFAAGACADGRAGGRSCGMQTRETQISEDGVQARQADLAWTGSEHGVVWSQAGGSGTETWFARLDGEGEALLDARRLNGAPAGFDSPKLTWAGGDYAITGFIDGDPTPGTYLLRVSPDGRLLSAPVGAVEHLDVLGVGGRSLAWSGTGFGLAWDAVFAEGDSLRSEVYFVVLDAFGNRLSDPVALCRLDVENCGLSAAVWTGRGFRVFLGGNAPEDYWDTGTWFADLDSNGDPTGPVTRTALTHPMALVVRDGDRYLTAFTKLQIERVPEGEWGQWMHFAVLDAAGAIAGQEQPLVRDYFATAIGAAHDGFLVGCEHSVTHTRGFLHLDPDGVPDRPFVEILPDRNVRSVDWTIAESRIGVVWVERDGGTASEALGTVRFAAFGCPSIEI